MAWDNELSARMRSLPPDWHKRRARVLRRDGRQCQIRGPRCIGKATDVDHIGDRNDHSEANLQSACSPCHRGKTARQGATASGRARSARAKSRFRPEEPHPGTYQ